MIEQHLEHLTEYYEQVDKVSVWNIRLAIIGIVLATIDVALFAYAIFVPWGS